MKNIFVIGSTGQIGSELTMELRKRYGNDHVVAGYITGAEPKGELRDSGPMALADVTNMEQLADVVKKYNIDAIYNLAALLSVVAESKPLLAWKIGIDGLFNVLEIAKEHKCSVFTPSSIGSFGLSTPHTKTPQDTVQRPKTMYGVSKVTTELLSDYYHSKYGVDTRSVRFPGLISYVTPPGGGTTDYAVQIYYDAIKYGKFECFLSENSMLPMMYMPDCLKATLDLFHADKSRLKHSTGYNIAAFSVTPKDMFESVKKYMPNFEISYKPDFRQAIADSWPNSIDDSRAREEWDWKPAYDLDTMTREMLDKVGQKYKEGKF